MHLNDCVSSETIPLSGQTRPCGHGRQSDSSGLEKYGFHEPSGQSWHAIVALNWRYSPGLHGSGS